MSFWVGTTEVADTIDLSNLFFSNFLTALYFLGPFYIFSSRRWRARFTMLDVDRRRSRLATDGIRGIFHSNEDNDSRNDYYNSKIDSILLPPLESEK